MAFMEFGSLHGVGLGTVAAAVLAGRIIYLYEMLNILIVDEKVQLLPIREGIINKLKIVKNISENRDSNVKNYNVINDSIRQLKQSLINIRKKIPRLTD